MAAVLRTLEEDGVAVLPGVLTETECNDHITHIHTWLAQFGEKGFPETRGSIIHNYKAAHHPVAWSTRLRTTKVFEALWETDKLISSIDGMAIGHPPELGNASVLAGRTHNLHLDQGDKKKGLHAYQGAVYLETADEDDWCFVVMNGSHSRHQDFFENREPQPAGKGEFLLLSKDDIAWYESMGCPVRRVPVPKGGMVLWDSRTVHAGAPPHKHRQHPDRWRYVVFVCMVPAAWASPEDMAKKKEAYETMSCSRHWPAHGFEVFNEVKTPPEYHAVRELPDVARTEKARLLAGDLQYDFIDGKPNGPPKPEFDVCN